MPNETTTYDAHDQIILDRAKTQRHYAEKLGMTMEEFHLYKTRLKLAWEAGGGMEGARTRLKFAESFLSRHKERS